MRGAPTRVAAADGSLGRRGSGVAFRGLSGVALTPPDLSRKIPKDYTSRADCSSLIMVADAMEAICKAKHSDGQVEKRLPELLKGWADGVAKANAELDSKQELSCIVTNKRSSCDSDSDEDWELALMIEGGETIAFEVGAQLERLEAETPGLGRRIASAIDSSPFEAYTLANATECLENWQWGMGLSEKESREEFGDSYVSEEDLTKHAPLWAWSWKHKKDAFAIASDKRLDQALNFTEHVFETFRELRKGVKWIRPYGFMPGIYVHWRGAMDGSGTSLVERMGDMEMDDKSNSYGVQLASAIFPLDDKGSLEKAFAVAAAYVNCGSALLSLLNVVEEMPKYAVPKRRRRKAKTLAQILGTEPEAERVMVRV